MATTVAKALRDVHPRMLRARGEAHPQLSGEDFKSAIGRAVEVAIERSSLTKQEAAFSMGYADSAVIGRWVSGAETPQFARLFTLGERFRSELVIALAELAGQRIEIETVVKVRRTA